MKPILRLRLPKLSLLDADAQVEVVHDEGRGVLKRAGTMSITDVVARWPRARALGVLHPGDAVLTALALPPLPAGKLQAALESALDSLLLGDANDVVHAHGPREMDGMVSIAWSSRASIRRTEDFLRGCGLNVTGFLPATYALPVPATGWTVCLHEDGFAVVRTGLNTGFVYPLAALPGQQGWNESVLSPLSMHGTPSHVAWVGDSPLSLPAKLDVPFSSIDMADAWLGAIPAWSLRSNAQPGGVRPGAWRMPIAAVVAAALVWIIGLNVQAYRLESAGQAMVHDMHARVKAAFPNLGVIMNPLQQARQQRDARKQAADEAARDGFAGLLGLTLLHSPFAEGQVKTLRYVDGQLTFGLDTPVVQPDRAGAPAWVEQARQAGLSVEPADSGWRVRASAPASGAAAPPVRQAQPPQSPRTRS